LIALHYWVVAASLLALFALVAGAVLLGRDLAAPFRGLRPATWGLLLLLLGAHALFVKPGLPHALWHEQHAVEFVTGVDAPLGFGGLESMHGPVYTQVMKGAAALVGRPFSVSLPSLNYLFSLAAALLFFLCIYALSRQERLAWVALGMLLFLPIRLRLSTTEDMFVLVELFSLAALLCFTVAIQRRRPPVFALGVLSLWALMHLRAEMMLLAPLLAAWGFSLYREELPPGFFRARWVLGSVVGAALLSAPRVAEILLWHDPRIQQLAPLQPLRLIERLGFSGLNAFFTPGFTPVLLPVLFAVGLVLLALRHRRAFWFAAGSLFVLTVFYAQHLSCISLKVRTALASQFLFVGVAAFGFHDSAGRLGRRGFAGSCVLLACLLAAAPYAFRGFLRTLYTSQQEHRLLARAAAILPKGAVVVYLSEEDDEGLHQNRFYQRELLAREGGPGKSFVLLGVRRFFGLLGEMKPDGVYFYSGALCVSVPWLGDNPGRDQGKLPGYVHPLCRRMGGAFVLEPVLETELTGPSLSWDALEGERRTAGLYRIRGGRPPQGKISPPEPGAWESSTWIRVASEAKDAGQRAWALQALARAESGASSEDAGHIRRLREELAELSRGRSAPAPGPPQEKPFLSSSPVEKGPEAGGSVWMSPVVKQRLQKALDLFRRGKEAEGFAAYRGIVRVSEPETNWPVEVYCRSQAEACAPLQRAFDQLKRFNDEGIAFFQAGKKDAARERFAAALALDPSDVDSLLNAANAAAEAKGDLSGALGLLDRVVRLRPAKPGMLPAALNSRAAVLSELKRVPEAQADLREALRLAPKDWPLREETEKELRRLSGGAR